MYYTYIILCEDGSLYTGMTSDVKKRMAEHWKGGRLCAKYTRSHKPEKLEAVWKSESRSLACKLEYRIKKLAANKKRQLIKDNNFSVFGEIINEELYQRENIEEFGVISEID